MTDLSPLYQLGQEWRAIAREGEIGMHESLRLTRCANELEAVAASLPPAPAQELRTITEAEFRTNAEQVLRDADNGIQTAVLAPDGKSIRSVIGLGATRFFPDPDTDPLDEIALAVAARVPVLPQALESKP